MNKKIAASLTLAATILAGCQMPYSGPTERTVAFPASEYNELEKTGTSSITGQLFLRTRAGDVKYGAGSEIAVAPVTTYSREATMMIIHGKTPATADPRASEYTRRTIADGSGRFSVENLPAGEYYVAGGVFWEVPGSYAPRQGSMVVQQISLTEGETKDIMLTK